MLHDKIQAWEEGGDYFRYCYGDEEETEETFVRDVPPPSAAETQLTERAVDLADFQLQELERQQGLQARLFEGELEPGLEEQRQEAERFAADQEALRPAQEELQTRALENIRSGGAATPEEIRLIDEASAAQKAIGFSDIDAQQEEANRRIFEEIAPSLGLRPGDTPNLDRAGLVAREVVRQKAQIGRGVDAFAASARLNFPLQRSQLAASNIGNQQSFAEATRQFQEGLRQQAFANRSSLTQQAGGFGLGLATGTQPNAGGIAAALGRTRVGGANTVSTSTTSPSFLNTGAALLGGAGGFITGLGAVGISSRRFKTDNTPVDDDLVLASVEQLPVEAWRYKGDSQMHIGPYAEDMARLGLSDGNTINFMDSTGLALASVKALSKKVNEHAARLGLAA